LNTHKHYILQTMLSVVWHLIHAVIILLLTPALVANLKSSGTLCILDSVSGSWVQPLGKIYFSDSINVCPNLLCTIKNTPIWQFSIRPAVPLCCRCTPTDLFPFFRNPVSSITPYAIFIFPTFHNTYFSNISRSSSASHFALFKRYCTEYGVASPQFLC